MLHSGGVLIPAAHLWIYVASHVFLIGNLLKQVNFGLTVPGFFIIADDLNTLIDRVVLPYMVRIELLQVK